MSLAVWIFWPEPSIQRLGPDVDPVAPLAGRTVIEEQR